MTTISPVMVPAGEGEHFYFLNSLHTTKVSGEQSNGALDALEFHAPRNFSSPLHRHEADDELFYILDGELWFKCGDVEAVHGEGAVAWLPRGVAHTFQVRSKTARVFLVTAPSGFDRFVAVAGRAADNPVIPEPDEIDGDRLAEIGKQFGIEILGPPPAPVN